MMAASGSGEGNFFSDVGQAGLGATEARRAFRKEKTAEEIAAEDREWKQKTRGREEGQWGAEDREKQRERKRRAAAEERAKAAEGRADEKHEKDMAKGDWVKAIDDAGNIIFQDPNTGREWNTGTKADESEKRGGRGPSVFEEQWQMYKSAHSENWEELPPEERKQVQADFMAWLKSSAGQNDRFSKILSMAKELGDDRRWMRANGNPSLSERMNMAEQKDRELNPQYYRGSDGDTKRPPPGLKGDELAQWYLDNAEE
jgi:hypothetical protein